MPWDVEAAEVWHRLMVLEATVRAIYDELPKKQRKAVLRRLQRPIEPSEVRGGDEVISAASDRAMLTAQQSSIRLLEGLPWWGKRKGRPSKKSKQSK